MGIDTRSVCGIERFALGRTVPFSRASLSEVKYDDGSARTGVPLKQLRPLEQAESDGTGLSYTTTFNALRLQHLQHVAADAGCVCGETAPVLQKNHLAESNSFEEVQLLRC